MVCVGERGRGRKKDFFVSFIFYYHQLCCYRINPTGIQIYITAGTAAAAAVVFAEEEEEERGKKIQASNVRLIIIIFTFFVQFCKTKKKKKKKRKQILILCKKKKKSQFCRIFTFSLYFIPFFFFLFSPLSFAFWLYFTV